MARPFTSFICLAGMRTGSNFLEENLNRIAGLRCWGEAFNPHFIGHAGETEMAGVTLDERERRPFALLDAIAGRTEGLAGFRFFHDHDPRVLARCLDDAACAKIVLTRNPVDSFVSLEIARQTGQWRLGDLRNARRAKIVFEAGAFRTHLDTARRFQSRIARHLQTTGQTAFHLAYEDVADLGVLNGLAAWLGAGGRVTRLSDRTKVQNPAALSDKVENYDEMIAALSDMDPFDLARMPIFEPRRGPNVSSYLAAAASPLLYMPVRGGSEEAIAAWLTALDAAPPGPVSSQKDLRKWKRQHPGHRTFTVLAHPVARLHATFCRHILMHGPSCFSEIREILRARYGVKLPEGDPDGSYDAVSHRAAFLRFADFVKGNLGGQTSIRTDPAWASQSVVLQGMAEFTLPDLVLREGDLRDGLRMLAGATGRAPPPYRPHPPESPVALESIYDEEIELRVRDIYQRDYMMFGFRAWQ